MPQETYDCVFLVAGARPLSCSCNAAQAVSDRRVGSMVCRKIRVETSDTHMSSCMQVLLRFLHQHPHMSHLRLLLDTLVLHCLDMRHFSKDASYDLVGKISCCISCNCTRVE